MKSNRVVTIATSGAGLLGAALLLLACTYPAYRGGSITSTTSVSAFPTEPAAVTIETSRTLVEENGPGVLVVAGGPLVAAVAVGLLLSVRGSWARAARVVAWGLTGLVLLVAMLGMLTIGPLILPIALALFIACSASGARPSPAPTSPEPHAPDPHPAA